MKKKLFLSLLISLECGANIPCQYDSVCDFHSGIAIVKQNGKFGAINTSGTLVIPIEFDELYDFNSAGNVVFGKKESKDRILYGIMSNKGTQILPPTFDCISSFINHHAIVCKDGKYGVVDSLGVIRIPVQFDRIVPYSLRDTDKSGLVAAVSNGKTGFVDINTGMVSIPFIYDDDPVGIVRFSEGFCALKKDGEYVCIDMTGNECIRAGWKYISEFNNGTATATKESNTYVIDTGGNEITNLGNVRQLISDGRILLAYYGDSRWKVFDNYGTELSQIKCQSLSFWEQKNLLVVRKKNLLKKQVVFITDIYGQPICRTVFQELGIGSDENCPVKKHGKWGVFSINDKKVTVPCSYEDIWYFKNGLAHVQKNGRHGFIDNRGKEVIPFNYEDAHDMSEGLAAVKQNGKWGFVYPSACL